MKAGAIIVGTVVALAAVATAVTPLAGEKRTAGGAVRNTARYIVVSDGTPIAADIWLPQDFRQGEKLPVLLTATRYWRQSGIGWLQRAAFTFGFLDRSPDLDDAVELFNRRRFIVVAIDVRGTGASGGNRPAEWAPAEVRDLAEIARWASRQTWSNGKVGAFGVSYAGNTAEMVGLTGEPAIKAVVPMFDDFDPQLGNSNPGGAFNTGFITGWGEANRALDRNDVCALTGDSGLRCWLTRLWTSGVKPVDTDRDGRALRELVRRRRSNNVLDALKDVAYRDDAIHGAGTLRVKDISPYGRDPARAVPMLVLAGWMDAATADGALARFLTRPGPQQVYIGAWSHGGRHDTDPFAAEDAPPAPSWRVQRERAADFFDDHLRGSGTSRGTSRMIHYFTMGERRWHATPVWPPAGTRTETLLLGPGTLGPDSPAQPDHQSYAVDFAVTSGKRTRWHTQADGGDVVYAAGQGTADHRLHFTGPPLATPLRMTGSPVLSLAMASSAPDGLVIAHLEAVSPQGRVHTITEGVLRLANRSEGGPVPYVSADGLQRSFTRGAARPMIPGQTERIRIPLYATSVLIPAGWRLRLSLAGADAGLFDRLPAHGPATWTINLGGPAPSALALPRAGS